MKRNEITTLDALRVGDRFTYLKRVDAWQVVEKEKGKVAVNQFLPWGDKIHRHDDVKPGKIQVRFLRHTRPEPGEECNMIDLQLGDVFYFPDNIVKEFRLVETEGYQIKRQMIQDLMNGESVPFWPNPSDMVVFVRKEGGGQ
jgi:hypothetical protein